MGLPLGLKLAAMLAPYIVLTRMLEIAFSYAHSPQHNCYKKKPIGYYTTS